MKKILFFLLILVGIKGFSQAVITGTGNVAPAGNFPAFYDEHFKGSYRVVADTNERNNIPSSYRKNLMLVGDATTKKVWKLDSSASPMWTEFGAVSGGTFIHQNGDSLGTTVTIGTKDDNDIALMRNGNVYMYLTQTGGLHVTNFKGFVQDSGYLGVTGDVSANNYYSNDGIIASQNWVLAQGYGSVGGGLVNISNTDGDLVASNWQINDDGSASFAGGNFSIDPNGYISSGGVLSATTNGIEVNGIACSPYGNPLVAPDFSYYASQQWVLDQGYSTGGSGVFTDDGNFLTSNGNLRGIMTAYWTIDQYGQFNGNSNNANYASIAGYADNSGSADNISYTWFDDGNSLNSGGLTRGIYSNNWAIYTNGAVNFDNSAFTSDGSGNVTANSFIKSGGTSSQYLLADGSTTTDVVTSTNISTYAPSPSYVENNFLKILDKGYYHWGDIATGNNYKDINLNVAQSSSSYKVVYSVVNNNAACALNYNYVDATAQTASKFRLYFGEVCTGVQDIYIDWYITAR